VVLGGAFGHEDGDVAGKEQVGEVAGVDGGEEGGGDEGSVCCGAEFVHSEVGGGGEEVGGGKGAEEGEFLGSGEGQGDGEGGEEAGKLGLGGGEGFGLHAGGVGEHDTAADYVVGWEGVEEVVGELVEGRVGAWKSVIREGCTLP